MADKNTNSLWHVSRKSLSCLFTISVFLFMFSWFFFLCSAGRANFFDQILLPNSKLFSVIIENRKSQPQNRITESSFTVDKDDGSANQETTKCDPNKAILKVFMYDLPPEFHFGLLDWKGKQIGVWPDLLTNVPNYPGGLNLQHSIEYWLILDLLSSRFIDRVGPCSAFKVENSSEADVVFVPFFSSLSYNRHSKVKPKQQMSRNKLLQQKLVDYLMAQDEWKASGGRDHVIVAHHPNSMLDARMKLWPAMFILADFGRYPQNIANVEKDVIAPYKHVVRTFVNDSSGYHSRPILLYFQGAIYRKDGGFIRQELFYLLKDEKDVHFSFGSAGGNGIRNASQGMHSSKFCLNIAGDTPSSNRLFDAIVSHCVPVIISDEIELPYEDVLDYSKFCIFVRTSDALKAGFLIRLIRSIGQKEWTRMWERLKEIKQYYEFQYPSRKDDAVQMIWQAVALMWSQVPPVVTCYKNYQHVEDSQRSTSEGILLHKPWISSLLKDWSIFWKLRISTKTAFFVWCMAWEKVITIDNLIKRRMFISNRCAMCKVSLESMKHLFIHCPLSYQIWVFFMRVFKIMGCLPASPKWLLSELTYCKNFNGLCKLLLSAIFSVVWSERNRRIFEGKCCDLIYLIDDIKFLLIDWASLSSKFQGWKKSDILEFYHNIVLDG